MKINSINTNINKFYSFGASVVNINAFSDTHGELMLANNAFEEMRSRKNDIFCREEKGSTNVLAICGDWFMDGGKTGFLTNPNKKNAEFQLDILNEFIRQVRKIAGNTTAIFTSGNHEFDGGVELLDKILSKIDAEVLMTNLDISNSPAFAKSISKNKIINEKVVEAEDDKNPDLKHKVLFLGVSPVNMGAYQENTKGLKFIDNIIKPQRYVKKEDYEATTEECKKRINAFKSENPDGIVVLLSHTGVGFADNLVKESAVDLVFDGHEHKDDIRYVNGVPIISLSQNFKKIVNAKIKISDSGKLDSIKINPFSPLENKSIGPLLKFFGGILSEDIKKRYSIRTDSNDIKMLDVKDIRLGNNFLANFVTDSILEEIRKKDSSVDFFALNASAIRHPLKISDKVRNSAFDVMNVLAGIKDEDGGILTTELSGLEVVYMVLDNYLFNKENPQRNPIIHYSGLITDRTGMLQDYMNGKTLRELAGYVIDASTNKPVDPDKTYKIANVEKYFNKSQNPIIKGIKDKSVYTGNTVQALFKKHFEESDSILYAKCDVRVK